MDVHFDRVTPEGLHSDVKRALAEEVPIAIEVNGSGYAVMMATPADLEDFAFGFARAERLGTPIDVDVHPTEQGFILRVTVADGEAVIERVRHRTTDSACGLCGIDNLEAALRPLPRVVTSVAEPAAVFRAASMLRDWQPLNAATGAVHAGAV